MEVQVVERWADWREGPWQKDAVRKAAGKLALGGDGQLDLTASLGMGDWAEKPARLFWRGDHDMEVDGKSKIEVHARVRNQSKRHVRVRMLPNASELADLCRGRSPDSSSRSTAAYASCIPRTRDLSSKRPSSPPSSRPSASTALTTTCGAKASETSCCPCRSRSTNVGPCGRGRCSSSTLC